MNEAPVRLAPVLTTERLVLRGHTVADLERSAAMWCEPLVYRHISGKPATREEAWSRLLRYAGLWAHLGFGYWLVEERDTGRFVGEVGFANFHREVEPSLGDALEVGWVLHPSAHGRGLATEAVRHAFGWADRQLGPRRSVCLIAPANAGSLRVAEKCGFAEFARTTYKGQPTVLLDRG